MTDELYINGIKADMKADSGIHLDYRSNLFGDFSKITSNFSYTIGLPVTPRNIALVDGSVHPGTKTTFPVVTHDASVYRDGVPIVQNASLHLIKTSPKAIEVAITWGVGTNLQRLINQKDKLSDLNTLEDDDGNLYSNIPYGEITAQNARWLPNYLQGLNGLDKVYRMPAVPVGDILRGICRKYGVILNFGNVAHEEWAIPITKAGGNNGDYGYNLPTTDIESYDSTDAIPLFIGRGSSHYQDGTDAEWVQRTIYGTRAYTIDNRMSGGKQKVRASIQADFTMWRYGNGEDNYATVDDIRLVLASITPTGTGTGTFKMDADHIIQEIKPTLIDRIPSLNTKITFNDVIEYDQPPAMPICAFIYAGGKLIYKGVQGSMYSKITCKYDAEYSTTSIDLEKARLEGRIPLAHNLPDLEVVSFIKAIAQMSGLFPVVGAEPDRVEFVPFASVMQKSRAVDWSDYLVADKSWLPTMQFKQGNEGKTNLFKYKEGDGKGWDGSFTIDNEALEEEKTLVDLPFTTFRDINGKAYIPLFEYTDGQDGKKEVSFKGDDKTYIMQVASIMSEYVGVDMGVKWNALLLNNYQPYINMLRNARVIAENFILTGVQLSTVDFTKPVYLKQYGAFFAIIEIKTKANNLAEVSLIKI